jgi:hypothetical protein
MKKHAMGVSLLALFANGLLLGSGDAMAQTTSSAATPDVQSLLDSSKKSQERLRWELERKQQRFQDVLNVTVQDADKIIAETRQKIAIQQGLLKDAKTDDEQSDPKRALEEHQRLLDHYMLARSKQDPNANLALDLAGGMDLKETQYAKELTKEIDRAKDYLVMLEWQIKHLERGVVPPAIRPGFVPNLRGMNGAQANAVLRLARLRGAAKYEGNQPKDREERDKMIVVGQLPVAGTPVQPGAGPVTVTLSSKTEESTTVGATNQSSAPKDGRYKLATASNFDLASMVTWENQPDGSAKLTIMVEPVSASGFVLSEAGLAHQTTFAAASTQDGKAYIVAGTDFQEFVNKLALPKHAGADVRNVQSNLRFVVTTEGEDLRLKLEGKVSWIETGTDAAGNRGPLNKSEPESEITLIGKVIR